MWWSYCRGHDQNSGWTGTAISNTGLWGCPIIAFYSFSIVPYLDSHTKSFQLMYSTGCSSPSISWDRMAPNPLSDALIYTTSITRVTQTTSLHSFRRLRWYIFHAFTLSVQTTSQSTSPTRCVNLKCPWQWILSWRWKVIQGLYFLVQIVSVGSTYYGAIVASSHDQGNLPNCK